MLRVQTVSGETPLLPGRISHGAAATQMKRAAAAAAKRRVGRAASTG